MRRGVFIAVLVSLSGSGLWAGASDASEIYLKPTGVHMHNVRAAYDKDHCGNFFAELPLTGLDRVSPAVREFRGVAAFDLGLVGYANRLQKGADPAPCDRWQFDAVQLAYKFNLAGVREAIADDPDNLLGAVFLSWEPRAHTMSHLPGFAQRRPYESCRSQGFVVGRPTSDPSGGFTEAVVPECGDVFRPGCLSRGDRLTSRLLTFSDRVVPRNAPIEEARPANLSPDAEWPLRHMTRVTPIFVQWMRGDEDHIWLILSPHVPPALTEEAGRIPPPSGNSWFLNCWRLIRDVRLRVTVND